MRVKKKQTFPVSRSTDVYPRLFEPYIRPKVNVFCDHAQLGKGKGCVKDVNAELGGQMRVTLDREGPLFHAIYRQRTTCKRINSQAKAFGIERPKVRNGASVNNLNTLTYLVINGEALQRARSIHTSLLSPTRLKW